jgi:hypothetical protein
MRDWSFNLQPADRQLTSSGCTLHGVARVSSHVFLDSIDGAPTTRDAAFNNARNSAVFLAILAVIGRHVAWRDSRLFHDARRNPCETPSSASGRPPKSRVARQKSGAQKIRGGREDRPGLRGPMRAACPSTPHG